MSLAIANTKGTKLCKLLIDFIISEWHLKYLELHNIHAVIPLPTIKIMLPLSDHLVVSLKCFLSKLAFCLQNQRHICCLNCE